MELPGQDYPLYHGGEEAGKYRHMRGVPVVRVPSCQTRGDLATTKDIEH